jgi:hypothetical protein
VQLTLPIIFIAIGGLALVTRRNSWFVLGGLLAQWAGLALLVSEMPAGTSAALVESVTAIGCCGIFALTVWNLDRTRSKVHAATVAANPRREVIDQLWLWVSALVAGVAGYGLAQLYPLGGSPQDMVPFYWILLPSILALVIDGSRDPVKLGAGLLPLFNAGLLLVYIFSSTSPGVALFGLAAISRLAIAAIMAYGWLFLQTEYGALDLNSLFDMRDGRIATETALAVVPEPAIEDAEGQTDGEIEEGIGDSGPAAADDPSPNGTDPSSQKSEMRIET